eukprot:TRINITY_DN64487_c0_g1_i1.p1 TRINITY_DN64487_c0_g1~~TRINITY_DN64487_c0_g1_i1.p1  ORF type:complete len:262 (-),score=5.39 TRINITY_DN64487_c0_g1_i1:304-1089(-)
MQKRLQFCLAVLLWLVCALLIGGHVIVNALLDDCDQEDNDDNDSSGQRSKAIRMLLSAWSAAAGAVGGVIGNAIWARLPWKAGKELTILKMGTSVHKTSNHIVGAHDVFYSFTHQDPLKRANFRVIFQIQGNERWTPAFVDTMAELSVIPRSLVPSDAIGGEVVVHGIGGTVTGNVAHLHCRFSIQDDFQLVPFVVLDDFPTVLIGQTALQSHFAIIQPDCSISIGPVVKKKVKSPGLCARVKTLFPKFRNGSGHATLTED